MTVTPCCRCLSQVNPIAIIDGNGYLSVTFPEQPDPAVVENIRTIPSPHRGQRSPHQWHIAPTAVAAALRWINEGYRNVEVSPPGPSDEEWMALVRPASGQMPEASSS
jgi:hypothetical protein